MKNKEQSHFTRNTGARASRSIFENLMQDVMFEIPSRDDLKLVVINKLAVESGKVTLSKPRKKRNGKPSLSVQGSG